MAATIYSAPAEIGDPPELDYSNRDDRSWEEFYAPEGKWEEAVKAWCRTNGSGELRGEEVRWGRGDGYARYVVYTEKPLGLIHLATGDAWQIDDIMRRGLRLSDVRANVASQKKMAELFGRSKP